MLDGTVTRFTPPRRLATALAETKEAGGAKLSFAIDGLEADLVRYKLHAKTLAETFAPDAGVAELTDLAERAAAISGAANPPPDVA